MIKTTLNFKKFNALLFSAFLGGSVFAQCPGNITVNAAAGQCGAAVSYTTPATTTGTSPNGVINGSAANGLTGWNITNGGDGWTTNGVYFVSSFATGTMSQVIDLTSMSLTDTYMDTQPAITVSEDYIGWMTNYADHYSLTVQLRGESDNVIATYTTGNITTSSTLQTASHVFTGYGTGVRKVYIAHSGNDAEYWAGNYGAAVTNVQCTVATPAVTVAQTAGLASGATFPVGTTTNTFSFTASDNTVTTCSFDVIVNDNLAPVPVVQQTIVAELDADGVATITTADVDAGTVDNCTLNTVTLSLDTASFTCEDLGENTVILTATDGTNSATANATVTVVDNIAPVLAVQNVSLSLTEGTVTLTQELADTGSTDNCSISLFSFSQTDFSCEELGDNIVTVTAIDASGNVATATITVTVTDTTLPAAATQNITVQLGLDGTVAIDSTAIDNGSADNCSVATRELDVVSFNCDNLGDNTVTLTVTDGSGNIATATAIVTVEDPEGYCTTSGTAKNLANALTLYPNPTKGIMTINAGGYSINKAEVYDINGRIVKSFDKAAEITSLNISGLTAGVYFVKIFSGENTATQKIVKQ